VSKECCRWTVREAGENFRMMVLADAVVKMGSLSAVAGLGKRRFLVYE
jgi:hypothetical protein